VTRSGPAFNFLLAAMPPRISSASLHAPARFWTCNTCSSAQRRFASSSESFIAGQNQRTRKTRSPLRWAVAAGTVGAAGFFFADEVKFSYYAVVRSTRVVGILYANIADYSKALKFKHDNAEERDRVLKECHKRCAERTLKVCERNGSIFIKLGQHLTSLSYLLPTEWVETFIPLQDRCPVSSFESIKEMFVKDTGASIYEMFDTFEEYPIGSASLAQVHRATMKGTGQPVAVKVQHPALEQWVPLDMALTRYSFETLAYFFPSYDMTWLSKEMDFSLPAELDFREEGRNAIRAREYFGRINENECPVVIPDVKLSQERILVMEYVAGHRPDDLKYIDSQGIDRDEVSAALARIFNEMIFGDGAPLHCDPHAGNIAIRLNKNRKGPNFDVILYDHGLYRDIPTDIRRNYAKLWLSVIDNDEAGMRTYAKELAGITDKQFPLFASAITGRDYMSIKSSVVSKRDASEQQHMSAALTDGMLADLVKLLGQVPRIMLLILKTNDLTRSLDEGLQTRQGPVRTFLILARYCSRTVFGEQYEEITKRGSLLWPSNMAHVVLAWTKYMRIELRLSLYEAYISLRRKFGLAPIQLQEAASSMGVGA